MKPYLLSVLIVFCMLGESNAQIKIKTQTASTLPAIKNTEPVSSNSGIKTSSIATGAATQPITDEYGYVKRNLLLPFTTSRKDYMVQQVAIPNMPGYYYYILDGDIIVDDNLPKKAALVSGDKKYKWNGDIPFVLDKSIGDSNMCSAISDAIKIIVKRTKINFVQKTSHADYIRFRCGDPGGFTGGISRLGRQGGMQEIIFSKDVSAGLIVHEILHALGFYHEQSRIDRDSFIEIINANITDGRHDQFTKVDATILSSYDYSSIMHYGQMTFTKNGNSTIRCKNGGTTIGCPSDMGQRNDLTFKDAESLRGYYGATTFSSNAIIKPISLQEYSLLGNVSWNVNNIMLAPGKSLNDALYFTVDMPQKEKWYQNICTGKEEFLEFTDVLNIKPGIRFIAPIMDYYRTTLNSDFSFLNAPNVSRVNIKNIDLIVNPECWVAGPSLPPKPSGRNVILRAWAEENDQIPFHFTIMASWIDLGYPPAKMQQKQWERVRIQTDLPLSKPTTDFEPMKKPPVSVPSKSLPGNKKINTAPVRKPVVID